MGALGWYLIAAFLLLLGCAGAEQTGHGLLPDPAATPPDMVSACALAEQRCTRCHDTDRIVASRHRTQTQWMGLVDRMRRRPSSGIAPAETSTIVRCLVYRSNYRADSRAMYWGGQ